MNFNSPPPFELGTTIDALDTNDSTKEVNVEHIGKIYVLKGQGAKTSGIWPMTTQQVWAVCLRNVNATAINAKKICALDITVTNPEDIFRHADGHNTTGLNQLIVAADPFLPAAGAAQDQLFWGIIKGYTTVLTNDTLISVTAGGAIEAYTDGGVDAGTNTQTDCGYTLETSTTESADLKVWFNAPWF